MSDTIAELLRPTVAALGYELLGVELGRQGEAELVRLYIDVRGDAVAESTDDGAEGGITVDDCERVSRQVDAKLEAEDVIRGAFTLEVSSPGLDRPLFRPAHYRRFVGSLVRMRLRQPVDGRRRLKGRLLEATDTDVSIEADGEQFRVRFDTIDRARIVPEW